MENDTSEITANQPVQVKVSRLAIAAICLTLLGFILIIVSIIIATYIPRSIDSTTTLIDILINISMFTFISAIILGFISLILIDISGGKKTGRSFAVGSILLSIFFSIPSAGPILILVSGHKINYRMVCGTNLSGLGKAMLTYSNDYDDKLPYNSIRWSSSIKWDASTQQEAFGLNSDGTGGSATISSALYLLVKYADVTPKSFICRGDKKMNEFKPEKYGARNKNITDFWDFGPDPWKHNSYAYHMPYSSYSLTMSSDPGMAVAADRNPWIQSPGWKVKDFAAFNPDGNMKAIKAGNSFTHKDEGQNVLYLDTHVDFETNSFCGINQDNIYTSWDGNDIRKGTPPKIGSQPVSKTDSLLVNDPPVKKP